MAPFTDTNPLDEAIRIEPGKYAASMIEQRQTKSHRFILVEQRRPYRYEELLLRLPRTAGLSAQQDLVATARTVFDLRALDSGTAFLRAARAQGPLDIALLEKTFCDGPDVAWRLRRWRVMAAALDATDREATEQALAAAGCFPRLDPSRYETSRPEMDAARSWVNALAARDRERLFAMSALPLRIRGRLSCKAERAQAPPSSEYPERLVATRESFDRFAECLFEDSMLVHPSPRMRDGDWLPHRRFWMDGWTGSLMPIEPKDVLPRMREIGEVVGEEAKNGILIEAVLTDNNGVTNTFLFVVRKSPQPRVTAVFFDSQFED
jgi:hypothetical protein